MEYLHTRADGPTLQDPTMGGVERQVMRKQKAAMRRARELEGLTEAEESNYRKRLSETRETVDQQTPQTISSVEGQQNLQMQIQGDEQQKWQPNAEPIASYATRGEHASSSDPRHVRRGLDGNLTRLNYWGQREVEISGGRLEQHASWTQRTHQRRAWHEYEEPVMSGAILPPDSNTNYGGESDLTPEESFIHVVVRSRNGWVKHRSEDIPLGSDNDPGLHEPALRSSAPTTLRSEPDRGRAMKRAGQDDQRLQLSCEIHEIPRRSYLKKPDQYAERTLRNRGKVRFAADQAAQEQANLDRALENSVETAREQAELEEAMAVSLMSLKMSEPRI